MRKFIVSILCLTLPCLASGQKSSTIGTPNEPLLENIHLHLNKTVFFKGERLWFKAYVQDQIQKLPSTRTTNLHVGLFSKEGNAIVKKMFFVTNGVCSGDFEIDSTFVDDSYTIMAWTNYMKNFEVATPFLQHFKVLGNPKEASGNIQNGMTISVHLEGQRLVPNTFTNVGLVVRDESGNPVKTNTIQLVTEDDTPIQSNIQTNVLGHGRFGFYANPEQSYYLKIKDTNGQWITKELEVNSTQGIGLSVDNTGKDIVILKAQFPKSALPAISDTGFSLAIFNENNISFIQDITYDEEQIAISVNRDEIPIGVNTAVILDREMQPISQRMFFNQRMSAKKEHTLEVDYCLTEKQDSLQLDIILPKGHSTANVSISVLPASSNAYAPNNSIRSSFLVQPYLKKRFVDGEYFFEKQQRSKVYELDTRLLIEGTEKINWFRRVIDTVNMPFKIENNIAFNGRVLDADLNNEKQVSLISQSFGTINLFDVSSNKLFNGSLPFFEGDSVFISIVNDKGKLRKPKVELDFDGFDTASFDYSKWLNDIDKIVAEPQLLEIDENLDLGDRTIALEEVVVTESARNATEFQLTTEIQGRVIDKTAINRYRTFRSYIRKLGFQIRPNIREGGIGVYVFDPRLPGLRRVPVNIEGISAGPGELMNMPLSSIKTIVYNRLITSHQGPFISIALRYDYDALNGKKGEFTSFPVPRGFSRAQAYFTPNYPDFSSLMYKKYGAIWWESQLKVNSDVPTTITIPLNEQEEFKFFMEGMSADGFLYQTEQLGSPHQNNYSNN